jgi:hypothetical protein
MESTPLSERDWNLLLTRIRDGKCTPFLGAGAAFGSLPLGSQIATEWANTYDYPFEDSSDLVRVAQFLAVHSDPMFPKEEILRRLKDVRAPDFSEPDEPHGVLADLPLPLYLTTNYDNFMMQALQSRGKQPVQELCRWNNRVKEKLSGQPSVLERKARSELTPTSPVVFHLHGYLHRDLAESLVLTEDDYLDFLVATSRDADLIPRRIQEAFAGTSLLFLGYRIADWDFRVLFRSLVTYLERSIRRAHISVQLVPVENDAPDAQKEKVQAYLDKYFGNLDIRVYWGTCRDFAGELKQRWEEFASNEP